LVVAQYNDKGFLYFSHFLQGKCEEYFFWPHKLLMEYTASILTAGRVSQASSHQGAVSFVCHSLLGAHFLLTLKKEAVSSSETSVKFTRLQKNVNDEKGKVVPCA
jgi:hypothetical protein